MADRLDALVARKGKDDKTFWTKVGVAFPNKQGGWSVFFDALPLTDSEGRCMVSLFPPKERQQQSPSEPLDDSIPDF